MTEIIIDKSIAFVDDDNNGFISFSEFLTACVSPKDILNKEKLGACFRIFDGDHSGAVTLKEVMHKMG